MENPTSDNHSNVGTEIKNIVRERAAQYSNLILASQLQKALPDVIEFEKRGSLHAALQEVSLENISKVAEDNRRLAYQLPRKSLHSTEVTMEEYIAPGSKNKLLTDKFVRSLPVPIKEKRCYRKSIVSTLKRKPWYTEYQDFVKRQWANFISRFDIFHDTLKAIEGRHGAAIVAYFVFIRWLLLMNVIIFLLNLFFLVLPQTACSKDIVSSNYTSNLAFDTSKPYIENIKKSLVQNNTIEEEEYELSVLVSGDSASHSPRNSNLTLVVAYCEKLYAEQLANSTQSGFFAFFQNLLQGTGPLESTYLFIGSYTDTCHTANDVYSISSASLFVLLATLIICLIMMIKFSTAGIQEAFLIQNKFAYHYSNEVFSGWNYGIDNSKSAAQQHNRFVLGIKNSLNEDRKNKEISDRSTLDWTKLYATRAAINIFIIGWLLTCFYIIYRVAVYQLQEQHKDYSHELGLQAFSVQYMISFTLVILNGISPIVFNLLVQFEDYSPQTENSISVVRNMFLYLSSFFVLVSTLYRLFACKEKDICGSGLTSACNSPTCWETYIGQVLYKLCVTDLFVYLGLFGLDCSQNYITRKFDNKFTRLWGNPVFYLPTEVLAPILSQTILWFGMFYSPLLPSIMVFKLIVVFYTKKTKVLIFCNPSQQLYRASRFNSVFISLLLFAFFIVLIILGFEIDRIQPSRGCGPFRHYSSITDAAPQNVRHWVSYLTSYWVITFTSIMLCLMIHYYWRVSASEKELVKRLKSQLVLQSYDKQYLLKSIAQLTARKTSQS